MGGLGEGRRTEMQSLATLVVGDEDWLQVQVGQDHGLDSVRHRVQLEENNMGHIEQ